MKVKDYTKPGNKSVIGEMHVYHHPQIPCKAFTVQVDSIKEAKQVLELLAEYDLFQFKNRIKPDYCNGQGLCVYEEDGGYGKPDWSEWHSEDGNEIQKVGEEGKPLKE